MLSGHGDDLYEYGKVKVNFSSNVYGHFDHTGLYAYLSSKMSEVTHYPAPVPSLLEAEVSRSFSLSPEQVMVTNGATEAIYLVAQTFRGAHSTILQPTFSEYADACRMHVHEVTTLKELPVSFLNKGLLWLCNPNNPTGRVVEKGFLTDYVRRHPDIIFVIDASYAPFTLQPLITPVEAVAMPNVIMLHSMTKEYAVPGLRIGYVTACESLLEKVRAHRMPWSVNQMAQDAGHYLFKHRQNYSIDLTSYMNERERVNQLLSQMSGLEVEHSDTHILLCHLMKGKAHELKEYLYSKYGILIRDASNFEGLGEGAFRIAIQSPMENDLLVNALAEFLSSHR